jgi:hypothetical protein
MQFLAWLLGRGFGRQRQRSISVQESARPAPGLLEARAAAEVRARRLLLRLLDPAQRLEFDRHGYFAVQVPGRGKFWILPSRVFNVLHSATGHSYCGATQTEIPLSDLMLAQKLLLENNPDIFFAVANHRLELVPGSTPEHSLPERVMRARRSPPRSRTRWSEVSMIPQVNRPR